MNAHTDSAWLPLTEADLTELGLGIPKEPLLRALVDGCARSMFLRESALPAHAWTTIGRSARNQWRSRAVSALAFVGLYVGVAVAAPSPQDAPLRPETP